MRRLAIAGIAFGALAGTPAMAQNLPWCMVDDLRSGATTCAFTSIEQCLFTARAGNIGHCVENPNWPAAAPRKSGKRSRK